MKKEKQDKIIKSFKTEIILSKHLKPIMSQFFGNRRFVFNQLVNMFENYSNSSIKTYFDNNGKEISINNKKSMQLMNTYFSEQNEFLSNSHSQSNQSAAHCFHKAFSEYLDPKMKNKGKPKYKSKRYSNTFYLPNQNDNVVINTKNNSIYIKPFDRYLSKFIKNEQKIKDKKDKQGRLNSYNLIRFKNKCHKDILKQKDVKVLGITIKKENEKYFISIEYSFLKQTHNIQVNQVIDYIKNKSDRLLGIDLGLKDKLILSNETKIKGINSTSKYQKVDKNKKKLQKKLSKIVENRKRNIIKQKVSKGYKSITKKEVKKIEKSRRKGNKYQDLIKVDRLNFKVLEKDYRFDKKTWKTIYNNDNIKKLNKEIRQHELKLKHLKDNENHHISKDISENFDVVFMEDLTLTGMQKLWGNKIKNLSLGQLTEFIQYKTENQGKVFIKIDKFFPSSKTCCNCGNHKSDLSLKDRIYHCNECNFSIDRDINASINILIQGLYSYIKILGLGKLELKSVSKSIGELKDYLINKMSKFVDEKIKIEVA